MEKTVNPVKGFLVLNFIGMLVLVLGCGREVAQRATRYTEQKILMGTNVQIDVCLDGDDTTKVAAAYTEIWDRLGEISWRMNVYDPKSDVSKVNGAYPEAVQIEQDTYAMLRRAIVYEKQTRGAFLISVWPLMKLWRSSQESQRVPDEARLREVLTQIRLEELVLLPDFRVARKNRTISLDLGGIAKGYAIDEAARIFREHDFRNFFIDAGGDIYVGGLNCRGEKWRIGIKDPRDRQSIIETVVVSDQAVTTSGNYEQFIMINGERYSHIIDPSSGYPQKDVVSATMIARTAEEADVYSTALTVLGKDRGIQLINEEHPDKACLILVRQPDGRVVRFQSRLFQNYLLKP